MVGRVILSRKLAVSRVTRLFFSTQQSLLLDMNSIWQASFEETFDPAFAKRKTFTFTRVEYAEYRGRNRCA